MCGLNDIRLCRMAGHRERASWAHPGRPGVTEVGVGVPSCFRFRCPAIRQVFIRTPPRLIWKRVPRCASSLAPAPHPAHPVTLSIASPWVTRHEPSCLQGLIMSPDIIIMPPLLRSRRFLETPKRNTIFSSGGRGVCNESLPANRFMVSLVGPPAMPGCKPRQARKGATVATAACAGMWLAGGTSIL